MNDGRIRVALIARFEKRMELQIHAQWLRHEGFEVVSGWLGDDASPPDGLPCRWYQDSEAKSKLWAHRNLEDLKRAKVAVIWAEPGTSGYHRGGRHFDTGIVAALGKKMILIGPREHLGHFLSQVVQVPDWEAAKELLLELKLLSTPKAVRL